MKGIQHLYVGGPASMGINTLDPFNPFFYLQPDTPSMAEGGTVLDRPMFANGGPVNPPVDPQETMAPDVLATSSTGEPVLLMVLLC